MTGRPDADPPRGGARDAGAPGAAAVGAAAAGPGAVVPARDWYERDPGEVAADLLGARVSTRGPDGEVTVRLTEVEVYRGQADPASHAFRGPTPRNAAMFEEPGRLYVYRHLGLHHCVNVVTGPGGTASAVLLRAGEVVAGVPVARARRAAAGVTRSDVDLARGPARLAVALGLDLAALRADVTDPAGDVVVHLPAGHRRLPHVTGPRVGVSGDGADAARYPWRLWLAGEATVSVFRPAGPPRRRTRPPA